MKSRRYVTALYLVLGAILIYFSSTRWAIPIAAWLSSVFVLRFFRTNQPFKAFVSAWLVSTPAVVLGYWGVYPAPVTDYVVTMTLGTLIGMVPFLADRLITPKLSGIASTLVLPAFATSLEFLSSLNANFGTFASVAYTQVGNVRLMQVTSIAGIWPIVFLLAWFASSVNYLWEREFHLRSARGVVASFVCVFCAVLFFGGVRVSLAERATIHEPRDTVRIASIALGTMPAVERAYEAYFGESISLPPTVDDAAPVLLRSREAMAAFYDAPDAARFMRVRDVYLSINDRLLAITEREAIAGARIVAWSEANARVFNSEERDALISRASDIASRHDIYLVMGVLSPDNAVGSAARSADNTLTGSGRRRNEVIAVDPSGEVVFTYLKTKLAPGEANVAGDGEIPVIETSHGRLASTICWDMDFPSLIRRAGRHGADIMIAPSGDWAAITPWHANIAAVRGIENGFTVVRPARHGELLATDSIGGTVARRSYFSTHEPVLVADIPIRGRRTIYTRVGDFFAHLCLVGSIVSIVVHIYNSRRRTSKHPKTIRP